MNNVKTKEKKLNIGAGKSYIPGFINIDISPKANITLDLSKDLYIFLFTFAQRHIGQRLILFPTVD